MSLTRVPQNMLLGGNFNYIAANCDAEENTTGWATYADAAGNVPVDGTGGSATNLTFSRSSSSPLRGSNSFLLAQANATSLQGKGVSYDFAISSTDQAKVLSVSFDYNASTTFVAANGTTAPLNDGTTTTNAGNSDVEVFIYDITNAVLIPVSPQTICANGANNFTYKGVFQTASNSTSYRFILHVATASANGTGWTFKYDNVYVGPQSMAFGPPISDWISYPMAITAPSNPTKGGVAIDAAYWRRVGDSVEIKYSYNQNTAGSAGTGNYLFSLPLGISVDSSSEFVGPNGYGTGTLGVGSAYDGSVVSDGFVFAGNATNLIFVVGDSINVSGEVSSVRHSLANAVQRYSFTAKVKVAGWSSNTVMSADSSTRVVAASAQYTLNGTVGAAEAIPYDSVMYDTSGSLTTGAGAKFTAPVSGIYRVVCIFGSSGTPTVNLYKNGVQYCYLLSLRGSGAQDCASQDIKLLAGDYIQIVAQASYTVANGNIGNSFSVSLISGPATIAASETVAAIYTSANAQVLAGGAVVNFEVKGTDTHSAVVTGAANAWRFICPVAGFYQVNANNQESGSVQFNTSLYKNGVGTNIQSGYFAGSGFQIAALAGVVKLVPGDYLTIIPNAGITLHTAANHISIIKIGN